ncbi:hypothetical protein ACYOEI_27085 [Singulisphaera rosea]
MMTPQQATDTYNRLLSALNRYQLEAGLAQARAIFFAEVATIVGWLIQVDVSRDEVAKSRLCKPSSIS